MMSLTLTRPTLSTTASILRHVGGRLVVAGAGAAIGALASHSPLGALALGLAALALAIALDTLLQRQDRTGLLAPFGSPAG